MKNKAKKKTLGKLKQDVWKIFSRYIRLRDAILTTDDTDFVACVTCNRLKPVKEVDAGHFISRVHTHLLFDEQNVHAQCKRCNMPPDSGEQYKYSLSIKGLYGQLTLNRLVQEKSVMRKYTRKELEELKLFYKNKLKELTDEYGDPWG